jgi:hypothetical protein
MSTPAIRAMGASLALTLLVSWVGADHPHAAVPADDLALLTHRFHAWAYFHGLSVSTAAGGGATGMVVAGNVRAAKPRSSYLYR